MRWGGCECVCLGLDQRLGGKGFSSCRSQIFPSSLLPSPPTPSTPVIQVIDIGGQGQSVRCELWASDSALTEPFPVTPTFPALGARGLSAAPTDRLAALTIRMPTCVWG